MGNRGETVSKASEYVALANKLQDSGLEFRVDDEAIVNVTISGELRIRMTTISLQEGIRLRDWLTEVLT